LPNVLRVQNSRECRDFLRKTWKVPVLMVYYDSADPGARTTLANLDAVASKVSDRAIVARADVRSDPKFNELDIAYPLPEAHVIVNGWVVNRLHGDPGQTTLVDALKVPWRRG
jgi:hypothetical protein